MLSTQTDAIRSYIDYFITLMENEIRVSLDFRTYGPPSAKEHFDAHISNYKQIIRKLRKDKNKLVLNTEILLLSVIDHFRDQNQLDEIAKACTTIITETIVPEKFLLRQPDLESYIRTIVYHLEFVDTMSWFT